MRRSPGLPMLPAVIAATAALFSLAPTGAARAQEAASGPPEWRDVEVDIQGNDELWTLTIRSFLKAYRSERFSEGLIADIVLDLEELYRSEGMPFVRVRARHRQVGGEIRVTFRIEEGPRVSIREVRFEGMPALSEDGLREDLATTDEPWLGRTPYVEADLEADVAVIAGRLRREGFVDAVVWTETTFDEGRTEADVVFRARQGPRIGIASVEVEGNLAIGAGKIREALTFEPGEPYNRRKLERQRAIVREMYADIGYARTTVEATAEVDREAGEARVLLRVDEGREYRVRKAHFRGFVITSPGLLRKQLALPEGETYSRRRVRKTVDNLYRLGIFEWVRDDVEVVGEDEVDLVFRVKERPPGLIKVGGGYGSFEGPRGALGISYANVFGFAKRAEADIQGSRVGYRTALRYIDPRILQSRVKGQIELYLEDREDPVFRIYRLGGKVTVGRPIIEKIEGAVRARREQSEVSDLDTGLVAQDKSINLRSMALILTRDSRDAPMAPVHGSVVRLEWEAAGGLLGGDGNFDKVTAGYALFTPIHREYAVIALAARAGWIFPRDRDELGPIQEQFFTGGESTVRAFREKEILPRTSNTLPAGPGGNSSLVLNAELRFRIWKELWGGAFWDAGNVWVQKDGIRMTDLRHSPGVGLRYLTPVGPLRLDWAYKLWRLPEERPWELHLSVGFAF